MAVKITLKENVDPVDFINKVKELIDLGDQKGGIANWQYMPELAEFVLFYTGGSQRQWDQGAYMKVFKIENPITFIYIETPGMKIMPGAYGVLNGRFMEMLINHCLYLFDSIEFNDYRQ